MPKKETPVTYKKFQIFLYLFNLGPMRHVQAPVMPYLNTLDESDNHLHKKTCFIACLLHSLNIGLEQYIKKLDISDSILACKAF